VSVNKEDRSQENKMTSPDNKGGGSKEIEKEME